MSDFKAKDWEKYELFVASILRELDPAAKIVHNEIIEKRQIDVSIRKKIVGIEVLIIVQAKYYKKKVGIEDIDAFESVIREVGASQGILASNKGFTKPAKDKAKRVKIELYTPYDSSKPNFRHPKLLIPVVKTHVNIRFSVLHHFTTNHDATTASINFINLPKLSQEFAEKWVQNNVPKNDGHHKIETGSLAMHIPQASENLQTSFFDYDVSRKHYFKFMTPEEYRGMQNNVTDKFVPTFVKFDGKEFLDLGGGWQYVPNLNEIPIKTSHIKSEIILSDSLNFRLIYNQWVSL